MRSSGLPQPAANRHSDNTASQPRNGATPPLRLVFLERFTTWFACIILFIFWPVTGALSRYRVE
jgi:hypothetical protein